MEDNTPAHNKDYHYLPQARLGFTEPEWPPDLPNLNPTETIWSKLKDKLKEILG